MKFSGSSANAIDFATGLRWCTCSSPLPGRKALHLAHVWPASMRASRRARFHLRVPWKLAMLGTVQAGSVLAQRLSVVGVAAGNLFHEGECLEALG